MRGWLVSALILPAGVAQAMPAPIPVAQPVDMPLASEFDLGSALVRQSFEPKRRAARSRWSTADLDPPPGPPRDPPLLRWHGRKVKMRLSF